MHIILRVLVYYCSNDLLSQCEYHEEFNNLDDDSTYLPKKVRNLTQKYFQNLIAV